jgi:gluconolactonase
LRFPEGPVALPNGDVLVVEIEAGTLARVKPDGRIEIVATPGGGPNGVAIGPDGAAYICNNGGFAWHRGPDGVRPVMQAEDYSGGRIERVDLATGAIKVLYTETRHGPLKGPNDLVFDAQGGFWFTDFGKARPRELDRGGVYYALPDGSAIEEIIHPMLTPNGIGLSQDGTTLYVAETQTARVFAFAIEGPGRVHKAPWPAPYGGRLLAGVGGFRHFDSMAIDSAGNVCVATLIEGGITVISPDGQDVRFLPLPDRYTTNLCFGGPDVRMAFVTLSMSGRLVAVEWPRPGARLNEAVSVSQVAIRVFESPEPQPRE